MPELMSHYALVFAQRRGRLEPAKVHRRLRRGDGEGVGPDCRPGEADTDVRGLAAHEVEGDVGHRLPLLRDRGDLALHLDEAVEKRHAQAPAVLPELQALDGRTRPDRTADETRVAGGHQPAVRDEYNPDVVHALISRSL